MNLLGLGAVVLAAAALRPARRYALVVDTYEESSPTPILTHVFHGPDRARAEAVRQAHLRADAFFAGCQQGRFSTPRGSFACRNVVRSEGWR